MPEKSAAFLRLPAVRAATLCIFHAIVFAACFLIAVLLRFDFAVPKAWVPVVLNTLPLVVGVQLLFGAIFGFYRGWWRYVGISDVLRLVFGLTAATAVLLAMWYGLWAFFGADNRLYRPPRSTLFIDWAFAVLTLFAARVAIRVGRDRFRPQARPPELKNVLIIGAGDAGEALAREIQHRPQLGMKVVGFVDDQRAKWGSHIRGIDVRGPISDIANIAAETRAEEALIAIPSASGKRIREIIHHLASAELRFTTIPGMDQLVNGTVHVTNLRPVNVEDLLRRSRVHLPGDPVQQMFRGKRVVVTGAGGTIGSELASQILQFEPESLILLERSEYALYQVRKRLANEGVPARTTVRNALLDIQQKESVRKLLTAEEPHIVLHAAAHKHVPLGEENPAEYVRNNSLATRTLGELCDRAGVERFVLISSDKAINPTSVMGAAKRAAEILLLDLADRSAMNVTVVRFGNVIGSSGSVIPLFLEQVARGGPVTVTHPDVTRYFLRTSEAVSLVLQAATLGNHREIFMLDMGEPVKIADLARDLISLSNQSVEDVPIVFTGLRPGEKLFEEIHLRGESVQPTVHPQIVVTAAPQPDPVAVDRWITRARAACEAGGGPAVAVLHDLVPEYSVAPMHQAALQNRNSSGFLERGAVSVPILKETPAVSAS